MMTYKPVRAANPPNTTPERALEKLLSPSELKDMIAVCVSTKQSNVEEKLIARSAFDSNFLLFRIRNASRILMPNSINV